LKSRRSDQSLEKETRKPKGDRGDPPQAAAEERRGEGEETGQLGAAVVLGGGQRSRFLSVKKTIEEKGHCRGGLSGGDKRKKGAGQIGEKDSVERHKGNLKIHDSGQGIIETECRPGTGELRETKCVGGVRREGDNNDGDSRIVSAGGGSARGSI